jgi:hypothetical protein
MPVGQVHVRVREKARAPRPTKVGNRERLPLFRVIPSDST